MSWVAFIIDLSLTVFMYLFFPLCYEFLYGRVANRKAKKIALWNSIVCCIIFCIMRGFSSGWNMFLGPNGCIPAVFWYFIVKFILVDKKIPDKEKKPKQNKDNEVKSVVVNVKSKLTNKNTNHPANELRLLKNLLDEGIITQEEFDQKKKQILDL